MDRDKLISAPWNISCRRERHRKHRHMGDIRGSADVTDKTGSLPNFSTVSHLCFSPLSGKDVGRIPKLVHIGPSLASSLPRGTPSHVPRDPIQPVSGTLQRRQSLDSYEDENEDDEESDFFPASDLGTYRQRSNTCPEQRAFARKVKCRARNRPLTPPPANNVEDSELASHMAKLVTREKYHIHQDLPQAIPEQETEENALDSLDDEDEVEDNQNHTNCDNDHAVYNETGMFEMDD